MLVETGRHRPIDFRLRLTVLVPVVFCVFAPLDELCWRQTEENCHGRKVVRVVHPFRLGLVHLEQSFRLKKVPCLAYTIEKQSLAENLPAG